jgi:hypothetical protein
LVLVPHYGRIKLSNIAFFGFPRWSFPGCRYKLPLMLNEKELSTWTNGR